MWDWDIRSALARQLRESHSDPLENRIWSELAVCLGASRVDLTLINGDLTGFEIKSPRDNLDRLESQISYYGQVLDFAYIVSTEKHAAKLLDRVPYWWGVMTAIDTPAGVELTSTRAPQRNESVDMLSVAQLLWRDEAFAILKANGTHAGLSKATRWEVWDRLIETCDPDDLRRHVRTTLKARPGRSTDEALALDGAMSR